MPIALASRKPALPFRDVFALFTFCGYDFKFVLSGISFRVFRVVRG